MEETNQNQQDQSTSQTSTSDDVIQKLKAEVEQMTELAKRTMADFQNFKRRQEEERSQLFAMANLALIKSLLPILDNLDRAKQHVPEGAREWFTGIDMSLNQLHKALADAGLEPIQSLGQKFNPELHEALLHEDGEKDLILEELETGYKLGNKVIRHAKVKVGNGEANSNNSEAKSKES